MNVEIVEFSEPQFDSSSEGVTFRLTRTLGELIEEVGGFKGHVTAPRTGERVAVSLENWRERDLATTHLQLSFIYDVDEWEMLK